MQAVLEVGVLRVTLSHFLLHLLTGQVVCPAPKVLLSRKQKLAILLADSDQKPPC